MFTCPNCRRELSRHQTELGLLWTCSQCGGRAVGFELLRKRVTADFMNALWRGAFDQPEACGKACPACGKAMHEIGTEGVDQPMAVDLCRRCHFLWFDAREVESLPILPPKTTDEPELDPKLRELIALHKVEQLAEQGRAADWDAGCPDNWWQTAAGVMGMPIEEDAPDIARKPWMTWTLALLIVLASVWGFREGPDVIARFGLVPAEALRWHGLTFFTSFFLHAGVIHLVGNVYFLLIFGDNVEDFLGRPAFLLLLGAAALTGDLAHVLADPHSAVPCIGASGGVAGVITFYALRFPHVNLKFCFRSWGYGFHWIQIPAWAALLLWLGLQMVGAVQQMHGFNHVSSFAHLGGALVGGGVWAVWRSKV